LLRVDRSSSVDVDSWVTAPDCFSQSASFGKALRISDTSGGIVAQHTPCLPGLDVENDQAAGGTGIGQIGEPSIGCDAYVIQVAGWTSDVRINRKGPF
jgi:hypothetical protein